MTKKEVAAGYAKKIEQVRLSVLKSAADSRVALRKVVDEILGDCDEYREADRPGILQALDAELGLADDEGFEIVRKGSIRDSLRRENYIQQLLNNLKK